MMYIDLDSLKVVKDFEIKRLVKINDVLTGEVRTREGDILVGDTIYDKHKELIQGLKFSEYVKLLKQKDNGLNWASPGLIQIDNRVIRHDLCNVAAIALKVKNSYGLALSEVNIAGSMNLYGNYAQKLSMRDIKASRIYIGNPVNTDEKNFTLIGGEGLWIDNTTINNNLSINGVVSKGLVHISGIEVGKTTWISFNKEYGAEKSVDINGTFKGDVSITGRMGSLDLSRSKFGGKLSIGNLVIDGDVNVSNVEGLSGDNLELEGPVEVKGEYTGPASLKQYFTN